MCDVMKEIRYFLYLCCCLLLWTGEAKGQQPLSERAQISLLTSSPYEAEVFTVYGHAALRVCDPERRVDVVFNYGLFSFDQPFFVYRFARGETDYLLGATDYQNYIVEYQMRGSTVTEQILNLTATEKEAVWQALLENYRPENRTYRYNFFFDNCATRPVALLEKAIQGKIDYSGWKSGAHTFRDLINQCTRNKPWLTFGCDLALGSPTDREATPHEMLFLPMYLQEAFSQARIDRNDGHPVPLVVKTVTVPAEPEDAEDTLFTPLFCAWLVFFLIAGISWLEYRRRAYFFGLDAFLYGVAGLAGCVLFFLSFISEHPCTWPNWNLLWLQPLHLCSLLFYVVKKGRKVFYYYHFINFVAIFLVWGFGFVIPQHLNMAFTPLMLSLLLRSFRVISAQRNRLLK